MTRDELWAWGVALGASLAPGDLVALHGDLGAGKTTLAQAIAEGFGVRTPVTSPTYALAHRYDAPQGPLWHLDLYRLEHPGDLVQLGWDEIVGGDAPVLVEWPERAGDRLPAPAWTITLSSIPHDAARRRLEAR